VNTGIDEGARFIGCFRRFSAATLFGIALTHPNMSVHRTLIFDLQRGGVLRMHEWNWIRVARPAVLLLILLFHADKTAFADKADDDFNVAVNLYRTQRYDTASEAFGKFLAEHKSHPRENIARLYLALSLNAQEKYAEAVSYLQQYLKIDPDGTNSAEARYRLGECHYYLKDYQAAAKELSEFLRRHPSHPLNEWARLLLGDSWVATARYAEARDTLTALIPGKPDSPVTADARLSLGRALEGLKDSENALKEYQTVASLGNPSLRLRALSRIGALEYARSRFQQSADAWELILQEAPATSKIASAQLGAGMAWFQLKDFEKALQRLQQVPDGGTSTAQARYLAAMACRELRQFPEARTFFDQALQAAGDSPLAIEISFQRAQLEQTAGEQATAARLYLDIADRWPKETRVPDCLLNASELLLELGQLDESERLSNRLASEHTQYAAQISPQILKGRLQLARGEKEQAVKTLTAARSLTSPNSARAQVLAAYYLIRAAWESGKYDVVLEQTEELQRLNPPGAQTEISAAVALAAVSSLQLRKYDSVITFSDSFLAKSSDPKQRLDVSAARAAALAGLKKYAEATKTLQDLIAASPDQPQVWTAVLQAAEIALNENAHQEAAALFDLAARSPDAGVIEAGRSGLAWSRFKAGEFVEAEKAFAALAKEYPKSPDFAEHVAMQARSIEQQGSQERTAAAWLAAWQTLSRDLPTPARGEEKREPLMYVFDAGRQAARMLEKSGDTAAADKAWEALIKTFPNMEDADKLFEEWAAMHLSAERFEKADDLYRQLLEKYPDSPFAGQARLSLAESLLQAGDYDTALVEMQNIVDDPRYGSAEKEAALFHVVEVLAVRKQWPAMGGAAERFLKKWPESRLLPQVRLYLTDSQLQQGQSAAAREEILAGKYVGEDWIDRVWIVLAEAALEAGDFDQIDQLEKELLERSPESRFLFQLYDVQGRRWKLQPPPDFTKSRDYFSKAIADPVGQGTETAARCQLQIAETWVLQNLLEDAAREYFKVYLNYRYDDLRAQALYQAAVCETRLKKNEAAVRDFQELIKTFPNSEMAAKAQQQLKDLGVAPQSPSK
jgi:TolA-binding protein